MALGFAAIAQTPPVMPLDPKPAAVPTKPAAPVAKPAAALIRPLWTELTAPQQQALKPLAGSWNTLSELQKRKWLAISQNYASMPATEQERMHGRMAEWVALSAQQRVQARLNFAETKKLSTEEKHAKWEAYQALSEEEKHKLAARSPAHPPGVATAVKPVSRQKLATAPTPVTPVSQPRKPNKEGPKITLAPHAVDRNTLLPQPMTEGAESPAPSH